ncbi:XRE family transcriptional regulator [bacterium]|nr:MAG: XRE family transcriptional regulator [bacterium]
MIASMRAKKQKTNGLADAMDRIRIEQDMTYEAMAKKIGITGSGLYRLVHDGRTPNDRTAFKIARAYPELAKELEGLR